MRIESSLTTSKPDTKPLKLVLSRTPMMLRTARPTMSKRTTVKWVHGCVEPTKTGMSWLR